MKEQQDYIRDLTEIRSMMERSSKFLSLSGLALLIAGIYGLAAAFIAYKLFSFNAPEVIGGTLQSAQVLKLIVVAIVVLGLALGTALLLSYRKSVKRGEKFWNPTSRQLAMNMAVPLVTGGLLSLILIQDGLMGLVPPFTLLFYGIAMFNASKFTYEELKSLGLIQIVLGLISSYFVEYGLLIWAIGFGVVNIIYGIYIHYRYER